MNEQLKIADEMVISIDYRLSLDSGELVDESVVGQPLEFLQGVRQIIPGLEKALYGLVVGDELEVIVLPEEAYGAYHADNKQSVPASIFPSDVVLEVGLGLHMRDPENGEIFQVFIAALEGDTVVLDFNHPLAGQTLHFKVKIVDIRPATEEEIEHGHAHGEGDEHEHEEDDE